MIELLSGAQVKFKGQKEVRDKLQAIIFFCIEIHASKTGQRPAYIVCSRHKQLLVALNNILNAGGETLESLENMI